MVGANHSFVDFNLDISVEEKLLFEQLSVNSTSEYDQCTLNSLEFHTQYTEYLKSIGNTDKLSSYAASILARLINSYITHTHTIISGRSWAPNFIEQPIFWHTDNHLKEFEYLQITVAITLKGPSTMFCSLEERHRSEEIDTLNHIWNNLESAVALTENTTDDLDKLVVYKAFTEANINLPPVCSGEKGHKIHQQEQYVGTVFVAGKSRFSAIHTIAIMTTERIFISMTGEKPI